MVNVVVVGSVNVDIVMRVPRLPRPGETVTGGTYVRTFGGKGANAAAAAARLGARTWIVGLVGDDEPGRAARADLDQWGVDVSYLGTGTRHTGVALVTVDERGENTIAVASGANEELSPRHVGQALRSIGEDNAVVLANLEIAGAAVVAAARGARRRGWPFILNPAPGRPLSPALLRMCRVLTPNQHEVHLIGAESVDSLLRAGVGAVVVTRGSDGADLYCPGRPPHHQVAFRVDVADSTGAGDAFNAALAYGLAAGLELEEAVCLAAAAGALACRGIGARTTLGTVEEVRALVASSDFDRSNR